MVEVCLSWYHAMIFHHHCVTSGSVILQLHRYSGLISPEIVSISYIGLHSLPGGVNGLDIGEAYGHDAWFLNETNLEYSYNSVSAILTFIQGPYHPWDYIVGLINEASDNPSEFTSNETMTTNRTDWIVKYVNGSLHLVAAVNDKISIVLQDCFLGEEHWSGYFETGTNVVIDTHIYYFAASGIHSERVNDAACGQAEVAGGDNKFPVFVGEWSLQVLYNNSYDNRESIFDI